MNTLKFSAALLAASFTCSAMAEREKQALEAYELSSLKVEAVFFTGFCKPYASVRDPGGYLHRVFKGDYIGKIFGQVYELTPQSIKLKEAIEGPGGEWTQRESFIPIRSSSSK